MTGKRVIAEWSCLADDLMGLLLRAQTLNVTWWKEGAENTSSFQLMWVLLDCVVFSSFPQKLGQVLSALGVFERCDVIIIQKILWCHDIPCADTTQVWVCVLGFVKGTLCSAGGTPVLLEANSWLEGNVVFVRTCAWMCLTQEPGDTSTTVYWCKQY